MAGIVPSFHQHCNACGGDGKVPYAEAGITTTTDKPCGVCRGKGYWNVEDIRSYHQKYPTVCKASCGKAHREPIIGNYANIEARVDEGVTEAMRKLDELSKRLDALKATKNPFYSAFEEDFKPNFVFAPYIPLRGRFPIVLTHQESAWDVFCYECLSVGQIDRRFPQLHCPSCGSSDLGNIGTFLALI